MFDYHVHSTYSVDCAIPMAQSCEAAIAAGVTEIAITDHVDHVPADLGFGFYRPEEYLRELDDVRERFAGRLTVLRGAEVDYNDSTVEDVSRFLDRYRDEYDFIIGSVHYFSDGAMIFPDYFAGKSLEDVFSPYLDQVERAVATGWFDSIGHLDLPKRYAPKTHRDYDPLLFKERLEPIFDRMIASGVAFEINTSGLRQTPRTSMPSGLVVRWYADRGGKLITTGSDSHAAQTVGAGIPLTLDMLQLCGVENVASFRKHEATLVPITTLQSRDA
ncbi:MAG: histidinol-phosphatase HisJ family protein [Thermomicrobiales bacterium]|nr:histidinol-phosphatase HisJ family protein [Thermomicrobiales bacterium]MCA9880246.1 histidinol-phosphatase HisJ family protein [Thermomicrobiales bacterium]